MRSLIVTVGSLMLTAGVLMNAYIHKRQFYPSVVYITKSSPSMAVLYLQALVLVVLLGKIMRQIFFSQLRSAELEHLIERSWYAVTETCLAFTVFRDDFSPRFVALFTILLFLKCFHWLGEDRIDYMERSPVITWLFHVRAVSLLCLLGFLDSFFVNHAYSNTLIKGPSVQLVFGFEYAILLTVVVHIFVKYVLHTIDVQSENPWENKAVYLLYAELALGFVKCVLYLVFLAIMIKVHTFPLFVIRPMYLTIREFKKALNDVVMSRRAIRNMNTLYPDASAEDLAATDNVCIICREEMHTACKKLPCNHIFHTSCLRSWFQRQQTCPTCRMDVLRQPGALGPQARQAAAAVAQAPAPQPGAPGWPVAGQLPAWPGMAGWPMQQPAAPGFPPAWPPNVQQQPATTSVGAGANPLTSPGIPAPFSLPPGMPPFMMPPGMPPFMMPPSVMPTMMMPPPFMMNPYAGACPMPRQSLAGLSDDELRRMEGTERRSVEARVQCLQDINALLTAALTQMQQYTTLSDSSTSGAATGSGATGGGYAGGIHVPTVSATLASGLGTHWVNSGGARASTVVSPSNPTCSLFTASVPTNNSSAVAGMAGSDLSGISTQVVVSKAEDVRGAAADDKRSDSLATSSPSAQSELSPSDASELMGVAGGESDVGGASGEGVVENGDVAKEGLRQRRHDQS